jgi:hypothetical protein
MIGTLSKEAIEALHEILGPTERRLASLTAPGGSLVLTTERLIIIREGRSFRPRTGIRSWPLDQQLRIVVRHPKSGDAGRLLIERDGEATSFLVSDHHWLDALELVREAQGLGAR